MIESFYDSNDFSKLIFKNEINADISINKQVSALLSFLIKYKNFNRCLDIGTLNGKSAMVMALSILDLNEGNLEKKPVITIEKNKEYFLNAQENFKINKLDKYIEIYNGAAEEILYEKLDKHSFDLIFIDANKSSSNIYFDFAKNHINKGGLIIIDNIYVHINKNFPKQSKIYKEMDFFLNYIKENKTKYISSIIPYEKNDGTKDALMILSIKN